MPRRLEMRSFACFERRCIDISKFPVNAFFEIIDTARKYIAGGLMLQTPQGVQPHAGTSQGRAACG